MFYVRQLGTNKKVRVYSATEYSGNTYFLIYTERAGWEWYESGQFVPYEE